MEVLENFTLDHNFRENICAVIVNYYYIITIEKS